MLRRVGRWIARALLGLFVAWQLAFVLGLNFCEVARRWLDSDKWASRAFPTLTDTQSLARRRFDRLERGFTRWAEFTNQPQSWSLFAPNVWSDIPFVAVEFRWEEEPANARTAAGLVGLLANPGPFSGASAWAATAPRPPVLVLSDNEPPDVRHYFRIGLFRLRRYESNLDVSLAIDTDKTDEEMADKWRSSIRNRASNEAPAMRAYLEWRWQEYRTAHPEIETPRQVILHVRVYRIPPPSAPQPWTWAGPVDRPIARWRPHFSYPPGARPVEAYDLVAERYDVLP